MTQAGTAIITGSASGVGLATVRRLRERGMAVIGIDVAQTPDEGGSGSLTTLQGSVADDSVWQQAVDLLSDGSHPPLTAMVFSAARLIVGDVVQLTEDDWREVFDVNVFGTVRGLRYCIPLMARAGGGRVVFIASTDGLVAEQNLAAYCASKGALIQLMRAAAIDHARQGITVNAIAPGSIDTPFFRRHVDAAPDPAQFLSQKIDRHPAGRLLEADDVARVAEFLTSDAARGMTGSVLTVDGGLTACFDYYPAQAAQAG